jgi:DNA mismatch endonuclease (patch repair protein)
MASVRQRDTGPELRLRCALHAIGLRYRLEDRSLPGSPDLILPRFRAVVFVHGCFWHAHSGCKFATTPSSRTDFWKEKFSANKRRDQQTYRKLETIGWRVLVVWECATKRRNDADLKKLSTNVVRWLQSKKRHGEIGPG